MATRTYTRPTIATMDPQQLATELDTIFSRSGHRVEIVGLSVMVTHPNLQPGEDAAVNSVIAAYVYNPDFGLEPARVNLRGKMATLRQWAAEGEDVFGASGTWDGLTTAQRFVVLKVMGDRLTKFFESMADLLEVQGLDD